MVTTLLIPSPLQAFLLIARRCSRWIWQGPSEKAKPSDLDPLALLEAGDPAEWAEEATESWDFEQSVWRDDLTEGVKAKGDRQGNPIVDPEEIPGPLPGIPSASVQFAKLTAANLVPPSGLGLGSTYTRALEPSATIGAPIMAQTMRAAEGGRKSRRAHRFCAFPPYRYGRVGV